MYFSIVEWVSELRLTVVVVVLRHLIWTNISFQWGKQSLIRNEANTELAFNVCCNNHHYSVVTRRDSPHSAQQTLNVVDQFLFWQHQGQYPSSPFKWLCIFAWRAAKTTPFFVIFIQSAQRNEKKNFWISEVKIRNITTLQQVMLRFAIFKS